MTVGSDDEGTVIRGLFGKLEELDDHSLSDTTRRERERLYAQLVTIVQSMAASSRTEVRSSLLDVSSQIEDLVTHVRRIQQTSDPSHSGPDTLVDATGLYIKILGLETFDPPLQSQAIVNLIGLLERFSERLRVQISVTPCGASVALTLEARSKAASLDAAFALALYLLAATRHETHALASVVLYADSFAMYESGSMGSPHLGGAPFIQAELIAGSITAPLVALTNRAYEELRQRWGLRRSERGERSADILTAKLRAYQGDLPDLQQIVEVVDLSVTVCRFTPRRWTDETAPVAISLQPPSRSAIGTFGHLPLAPSDVRITYRDSGRAPDDRYVTELSEASSIAVAGLTNENLALAIDRAWALRQFRGAPPWSSVEIFFPSERALTSHLGVEAEQFPERSQRWRAGIKTLTQILASRGESLASNRLIAQHDLLPTIVGTEFVKEGGSASHRLALPLPGYDATEYPYVQSEPGSRFAEQAAALFKRLRRESVDLFEREVFGTVSRDGADVTLNLEGVYARRPNTSVYRPVTLVILHAESQGQQQLLLQRRSPFNSADSLDRFSNLSTRLYESDLYVGAALEHHPSGREVSNEIANTRLFRELKLQRPTSIPREAFEAAATRELLSGLGLTIDPDRLTWHDQGGPLVVDELQLFFRICSLELFRDGADEVTLTKRLRPYADLEFRLVSELIEMRDSDQLNRYLAKELESVFMPMFEQLRLS